MLNELGRDPTPEGLAGSSAVRSTVESSKSSSKLAEPGREVSLPHPQEATER